MSVATSLADVLPATAVNGDGDRWPWLTGPREAVVHPSTAAEVAATMRWAAETKVGVLVVASGRRVRGVGRLDRPHVVLSTDRLVGTEVYEPADLTITAKAGTPVTVLAAKLSEQRQWLPYDPPHLEGRSLGGLVATGESGSFWMGYGELRNHVLGATVVTGDGTVLRLGGRVVKNVAGFDLLKAIVGSRGRLGVMTSVCVRAFPVPQTEALLVLAGEPTKQLLEVARAVGTAPILPVSSVLVSGLPETGGPALLVRLHGASTTVDADHATLNKHCGVSFERTREERAMVAYARDLATDARLTLEVSVLPSRLPEAFAALRDTLGDVPFAIDTYRGNVRMALGTEHARPAAGLRPRIEALGGAVSAYAAGHVDDAVDLTAIVSRPSQAAAQLTSRLEGVFDPNGVLWPCRQ
jgi:glycolate oxidase FAD binding subunit